MSTIPEIFGKKGTRKGRRKKEINYTISMVNFFSRSHFPMPYNLIYLCRYGIELIIGNLTVANVFILFLALDFFRSILQFVEKLQNLPFPDYKLSALAFREDDEENCNLISWNFISFPFPVEKRSV